MHPKLSMLENPNRTAISQRLMMPFTAGCQQTPFKLIRLSLPALRSLWMFLSGFSVLQSLMSSLSGSMNYHNMHIKAGPLIEFENLSVGISR